MKRVKSVETIPRVGVDVKDISETPGGGNQLDEDEVHDEISETCSENDLETTLTAVTSTHQIADLSLLQDSVHEIKQSMETFYNQFEEKLHTSQFEQLGSISALEEANEKVLSQLTVVMDKLITMETKRKEERMKNDQNIEEIKRNQKSILETLDAMQKAKGIYLITISCYLKQIAVK